MKHVDAQQRILEQLDAHKQLSTSMMCQFCNLSREVVRRATDRLQLDGAICAVGRTDRGSTIFQRTSPINLVMSRAWTPAALPELRELV